MILIITATLAFSHAQTPARADARPPLLSDGLPAELPSRYLDQNGFVAVGSATQDAMRMTSPVASALVIQGERVSPVDRSRILDVFHESVLARIPDGKAIRVSRDGAGREVWDYPEGTEIAHLLGYRAAATGSNEVFELRLERKLGSGQWAFGIYTPLADGTLRLNVPGDASTPEERRFTALTSRGGSAEVLVRRIGPQTCRRCHMANSLSNYQYESFEWAGPCGFVPSTPSLKTDWASRYLRERGVRPFGNP